MIIDAVRMGASDIHIEPYPTQLKIRFRVDGVLEDQPQPPPTYNPQLPRVSKLWQVWTLQNEDDHKMAKSVGKLGASATDR